MGQALSWLIAFGALFAVDIFWTRWAQAVQDSKALKAAVFAVLLFVFGAVAVSGYVQNPWLILPSALGAFAGTYVAVKRK
jgi:hypothetical protein